MRKSTKATEAEKKRELYGLLYDVEPALTALAKRWPPGKTGNFFLRVEAHMGVLRRGLEKEIDDV